MKSVNFLSKAIYVSRSKKKGRGVFANTALKAGVVIEVAPVIVISKEDRKFIDKTLLHDYIFEWGRDSKRCCMALGCVSLYNHSYNSNCEYEMDFRAEIITIRTVRAIKNGEELFINYNGVWNNETPVWFDVK